MTSQSRTALQRHVAFGLVAAFALCTACKSTNESRPTEPDPNSTASKGVTARDVGTARIEPYAGRWESDPRLATQLSALEAVIPQALAAAEEKAGLLALPGRGPVIRLVDAGTPGEGAVRLRLVDGVRRPVVPVPARRLVTGLFTPSAHFAPRLAEGALLSSAGEQPVPDWLRAGLPVVISGTLEHRLHERALAGDAVLLTEAELFPETPSGDDPLWAATRLNALQRTGRGERRLARFVTLLLAGTPEEAALREVGIHGAEFLDAAADTDRARALETMRAGGPLRVISIAREALRNEDAAAAATASTLRAELESGTLSPYLATEVRVVLAELALLAGDTDESRRLLVAAQADPDHLLRPVHAELLAARLAAASGERATAASLYRRHAADHPDSPAVNEALNAIGVSPEIAARVPGVAADLVSTDPRRRGRAATRLGETGDPEVAPVLRVLAGDETADVRRLALAALALAVGEAATPDLERGTRDTDAEVRAAALRMLSLAAADGGLSRARELEKDPSALVRETAAAVLAPSRAAKRAPGSAVKSAVKSLGTSPVTPTPKPAPARTKTTVRPGISTPSAAPSPKPAPSKIPVAPPVKPPVKPPAKSVVTPTVPPAAAPPSRPLGGAELPPPVPGRAERSPTPSPPPTKKPAPVKTPARTKPPPKQQPKPPRPPAHRTDDERRKPPPPRPKPPRKPDRDGDGGSST